MTMNRRAYPATLTAPLERLFRIGTISGLSEGQLVARFVRERDESAFEAIVARHGPMVLGVCRRLLDDPQDVEDAFQATFLVLVKRARSLRDPDRLGCWLHGVAVRVARRSRRDRSRRRSRERPVPSGMSPAPDGDAGDRELRALLDAEVERLPKKFRTPIILCYFEGMTHDDAAARLECPVGTVRSRMAKARELLRSRLIRRGVAPTSVFVATGPIPGWTPAVSPALRAQTIAVAMRVATGQSIAASVVSMHAVTLTQGVSRTMSLTKIMPLVAILAAFGAAGGAQLAARQLGSDAAGRSARQLAPRESLDAAVEALEEARDRVDAVQSRLTRHEAEIRAMSKELENLRAVLRPLAVGGMGMGREEVVERLKPVAAGGSPPLRDANIGVKTPGDCPESGIVSARRDMAKTGSADAGSHASANAEERDNPVRRHEAEIQAMREELENLRTVLRPLAVGGAGLAKEEILERLKPVTPTGGRSNR